MAASIVERYERILLADPKSRVFVELARAFLDRGEPQRAVALCERGIAHHPDSVVARVVWGRALLAVGRVDEAVRRFDEATGIEPGNPYAYDLAGEALVRGGEPEHARALLERGAEAHPHDARIQLWLKEASAAVGRAAEVSGESSLEPGIAPARREDPPPLASGPAGGSSAVPPPVPSPGDASPRRNGARSASPADVLAFLPDEPPEPEAEQALEPSATPAGEGADEREAIAAPGNAGRGSPDAATPGDATLPPDEALTGTAGTGGEAADAAAADAGETPAASVSTAAGLGVDSPDPRSAEPRAATAYEVQLRNEILAAHPPAGGYLRRHVRAIVAVTVVVAAVAGLATFLAVQARHRESNAHEAADAARKGLARDTLGSLREAERVLSRAHRASPGSADVSSSLAEVAALLAHDFDDGAARTTARALVESSGAGPGTFAARWLVAATPRERESAAIALLERRDATPLASAVAGEVFLSRRENDAARRALEAAARASPPLLRAVTLLGDMDAAGGDPAAALERYRAVLRAQPTHPRAAIGAGEVSLALGRELDRALRAVEAVAADAQSAPPVQDRLRFQIVRARLLAAAGRTADATGVLDEISGAHPGRADVASARAEVLATGGDLAGALAAAETARRTAPDDARYREQVAQLQLRLARYRDLLAGTEASPTRALRTLRGIARIELGDADGARTELEATRRDGKMSPEAAAWMAVAEIASGRAEHAAIIVDALLAAPAPHPVALLARARLELAAGQADAAEQRLREAIEREPDLLDARYELGRLLLERGRAGDARDVLEKAVARAPWRASARVALARARLATGDRETAIRELEAVASERSDDPGALDAARRLLRSLQRR